MADSTRAVTSLVFYCCALVLQRVVAFTPHRCLPLKLLQQVRGDVVVVVPTSFTATRGPRVRHHGAALVFQLMVRAVMSARKGAAGQIRVGTALGLEGAGALRVAGVVTRVSLTRAEEVRPAIRVPQGHGVIRRVAGHRVVVTAAAGKAFHRHRGRVDVHIQGPKSSSSLLSHLWHLFSPVLNSNLLVLRGGTFLHLEHAANCSSQNRLDSNPLI